MVIIALVIGAGFGIVLGYPFAGATAGLIIGLLLRKDSHRLGAESVDRWQKLEQRLARLEHEQEILRAQLARLRATAAEFESPATAPDSAAPETPIRVENPWLVAAPPRDEDVSGEAVASEPERSRWQELEDSPLWSQQPLTPPSWFELIARWLGSGNLLAKLGVTLLFLGAASTVKLAVVEGLLTPALRLVLGTLLGILLGTFGWRLRTDPRHQIFSQVVQGAGFALLYLMAYFAFAWYGLIGPGLAFLLFSTLGLACTWFALAQQAAPLALIGLSGALLAPPLATDAAGGPCGILLYYLLINGYVFAISWRCRWQSLPATGFICTFLIGLTWAFAGYHPKFYFCDQAFLILFSCSIP